MFECVGFTLIKLGWLKLYQLNMVYVNSIQHGFRSWTI
jgi:hypothetical protein